MTHGIICRSVGTAASIPDPADDPAPTSGVEDVYRTLRLTAGIWTTMVALTCAAAAEEAPATPATERLLATAQVLAEALERFAGTAAPTAVEGRAMLAQARAAQRAGRADEAQRLAAAAYGMLRDGVRSAAASRAAKDVPRAPEAPAGLPTGYQARRASAVELRAAVLRIAAEKGRGTEGIAAFDTELARADADASAGRTQEAALALERAYGFIKGQLVSLRGGETLVRSLHFETPEQEFRYELDRNETFSMLVRMLAEPSAEDRRVTDFLERARGLRGEADGAAAKGDFAAGIRLLEESTREYQKVIRSAGVLIPG